jgi:hypothetical protein
MQTLAHSAYRTVTIPTMLYVSYHQLKISYMKYALQQFINKCVDVTGYNKTMFPKYYISFISKPLDIVILLNTSSNFHHPQTKRIYKA